jgi:hypothetical protein
MSKKRLLEESTIRSFMKLANLQPLSGKFLKEDLTEGEDSEAEEGEDEEEGEALEEVVAEEGEMKEEGMESEGRPSPKKSETSGKGLTGKATLGISGAKTVKSPGKLKPLAQTSKNTAKGVNVKASEETGPKSNGGDRVGGKSRGEFEIMENLELQEIEMEDEAGMEVGDEMGSDTPSDMAGETPEHQDRVKEVIHGILGQLQTLAGEYGIDMEVADEGGSQDSGEEGEELPGEGEEAGEAGEMESPEQEADEEDEEAANLQETLNVLTRRVSARLLKEAVKAKTKR